MSIGLEEWEQYSCGAIQTDRLKKQFGFDTLILLNIEDHVHMFPLGNLRMLRVYIITTPKLHRYISLLLLYPTIRKYTFHNNAKVSDSYVLSCA